MSFTRIIYPSYTIIIMTQLFNDFQWDIFPRPHAPFLSPLCEQETQFTTLVNAAVSLSTPPAIYLI